jgi:feruloyl-CoA synthase
MKSEEEGRWRYRREGETLYITAAEALQPYPRSLVDRLRHWAERTPDQLFLARRDHSGEWVSLSYAEVAVRVRAIASALVARDLNADRPIAILSGNSLEHALLALGAMEAGIPYCPVSPAYAQAGGDLGKLVDVFALLTPGLIFVDDAQAFSRALLEVVPPGVEVVAATGEAGDRPLTPLAQLLAHLPSPAAQAAFDSIGQDSIAKLLLTSGSTGSPKAVINTHGMLAANQQMIRQAIPSLGDTPPVLVDWLPWNHTFGGNKVVGIALYNGGSLYIDDGRPAPAGAEITAANLKAVSPTHYFNVPRGFDLLLPALERDLALRHSFYRRLSMMAFGGAALPEATKGRLEHLGLEEAGRRIPMLTGLGATETGPFGLWSTPDMAPQATVGLPVAGAELKLAPVGDKLEARVRSPGVMPGYWRDPDRTAAAFDDEGYYRLGDALRLVDPADPARGLLFDGRIAEDFKLSSGTWVSVGPLRSAIVDALSPLAQDVVIAGINRDDIRILVVPEFKALNAVAPGVSPDEAVTSPAVQAVFIERLVNFCRDRASSQRVSAALLMAEPLRPEDGETTDKGSTSQKGVLSARADAVERLYLGQGPDVITVNPSLPQQRT